ncbi:Fe(3+) ABC transporter substrate-binding protein [Algicella marina]|uniref:Extracellular solute-binding protein n=1 Tax=Algicella marina TaxID=2683284 RepID=A0A6P1T0T0_9RHOB|nr:Fe(3+) ABC transporter substrate-binding protein [Algicella marina]QHQ35341.1 extracellular solute-binding protein [Algicella marina]
MHPSRTVLAGLIASIVAGSAMADGVVNLYSSRHYDTDERLYSDFEEATGITINRIEGNADELIARMEAEGANSPADILLTVDASRTWRADQKGLYQPIDSEVLNRAIPSYLRHEDGNWFGFSQRARIFFYAKDRVDNPPQTYDDLADPAWEGRVCMRSATNAYSQTLLSSIILNEGEEAAKAWAAGLKDNLARDPQGGDTDQIRAVVSGECDVAVSNTYYFARAIRTEVEGISDQIESIGWVFPNQATTGTHVNVSTGGVAAHAPNKENAIAFLEYLASDSAQKYFSNGNDEYPAVPGVGLSPSVAALGYFRSDTAALDAIAENTARAQEIYNEVGFE